MRTHSRPRTFTAYEEFVRTLQAAILADKRGYTAIANEAELSPGTVQRIATGDTRWPRHTTLFALCLVLKLRVTLTPE